MQKRLLGLMLSLILVISMSNTTTAASMKLDIRVNDIILALDSAPYVEAGSTMIPLRTVVEALGATNVLWDNENKLVTIIHNEKEIILQIDNLTYWVNGEEKLLTAPPTISDNRTMVPLRMVAEELSFDVSWNDKFNTVEIQKPEVIISDQIKSDSQYSYEDVLWLARIVRVEGYNISYEAKLAIANVVLNRVKSPLFPGSIYEVIFDQAYATQFPPAHKSSFQTLEPDEASWLAAKNALDGQNNVEGCLYFNNRPFSSKSDDLHNVIEGEYFYY